MEDKYQIENKSYKVLPIKNNVVFPGVMMPIAVSKKSSLKLIKAVEKNDEPIILLTQKDNKATDPKEADLYTLGTMAHVIQIIPVPEMGKDTMMTIFEGLHRVKAVDFQECIDGSLVAHAIPMDEEMPLRTINSSKRPLIRLRRPSSISSPNRKVHPPDCNPA